MNLDYLAWAILVLAYLFLVFPLFVPGDQYINAVKVSIVVNLFIFISLIIGIVIFWALLRVIS